MRNFKDTGQPTPRWPLISLSAITKSRMTSRQFHGRRNYPRAELVSLLMDQNSTPRSSRAPWQNWWGAWTKWRKFKKSSRPTADLTKVSKGDLDRLPYLKCCIKEISRLRPPFPTPPRNSTRLISWEGRSCTIGMSSLFHSAHQGPSVWDFLQSTRMKFQWKLEQTKYDMTRRERKATTSTRHLDASTPTSGNLPCQRGRLLPTTKCYLRTNYRNRSRQIRRISSPTFPLLLLYKRKDVRRKQEDVFW